MSEQWGFVDETLQPGHGVYVLVAVLVDPGLVEGHRTVLRGLLLKRQPRLHWRNESASRRGHLAAAAAALDLSGVVVIGADAQPAKQIRARRKCLERLLWVLGQRGVTQVNS